MMSAVMLKVVMLNVVVLSAAASLQLCTIPFPGMEYDKQKISGTLVFTVQVELRSHHEREVGEVLDDGIGRRVSLVLGHRHWLRRNAKLKLHLK